MIDILMATYNGEDYIAQQLESILSQTFKDWRLLVSDDCSQDSTLAIIQEYAERDSRIEIVSTDTKYGSAKMNFFSMIPRASSDYVMFCDQDDVWMVDKIAVTYERMLACEQSASPGSPVLVFTDMEVVDSDLSVIAKSFEGHSNIDSSRTSFPQVLAQSLGAGCTMMVNGPLLGWIERTKVSSNIIMHDWWASLIAAAFGVIGHVDQATSRYRQHEGNSVGALRYSPLKCLKKKNSMVGSVRLTINQAKEFNKQFGPYLSEDALRVVSEYSSILDCKLLKRVIALFKSKCWKKGLRKMGQIYAIINL